MTDNKIIEETDDFIAYDTDHDYDFVTIIKNKTDNNLVFCPYGVWKEFDVPADDWIGLLCDEEGREIRYALLMGDYDYCKETEGERHEDAI